MWKKGFLFFLGLTILLSFNAEAVLDKYNVYQFKESSKKEWYEWWYYKIVLPKTKDSFFFVYGIVNPNDLHHQLKGTRSYVEMGDFTAKKQIKNKFEIEQFKATYDQTLVEIGGHSATDQHLKGDIQDAQGHRYIWDISIQNEWAFNAMGWAIDKDITNIKWYPAQASARCSGTIINDEKLYQFTDAPCYQDRNWGESFPLWWTWIVSNHFKNSPTTALAVGGGRPKYFNTKFPYSGVSIGLKHKGLVYHFRPNDLDNVKVDIKFGKWEITANNRLYKIEISAFAPKEKFMDLQFMTPTGEIFHDYETLTGDVTVKLYKMLASRWELVDTLFSDNAGIEFGEPGTGERFKKLFENVRKLQ
jgi:hypothetical protein